MLQSGLTPAPYCIEKIMYFFFKLDHYCGAFHKKMFFAP